MTDDRRGPDAVEQFLADLGHAPVPEVLASTVAAHVRATVAGERRTPAPNRWLALAAALVLAVVALVGFAVANRPPEPPPTEPPSSTASASASAEPPAAPTASPPATLEPTPRPTPTPPADAVFDLRLPRLGGGNELFVRVIDPAGALVDAAAAEPITDLDDEPRDALTVRQGEDERTLLVAWATFACDERADLTVETPISIRVRYPPRPGCDTLPAVYALTLTFDRAVDAAAIDGRQPEGEWAVTIDDLRPTATTWIDELNGWLGGRSMAGDAVIAHTRDGGATWQLGGHHAHVVVDMAAVDEGRAIVGTGCFESMIDPSCTAFTNIVGQEGGGGMVSHEHQAWRLSFEGQLGYGRFADLAPHEVRQSADGGESWTTTTVACVAEDASVADISPVSGSLIYALCHGAPMDGRMYKELLVSGDGGRSWERQMHSSQDGGLPSDGNEIALEMAADGTGVIWGNGMPLIVRREPEQWVEWDAVDVQGKTVLDVAWLGMGRAILLINDPALNATVLTESGAGRSLREIWRWPLDQ